MRRLICLLGFVIITLALANIIVLYNILRLLVSNLNKENNAAKNASFTTIESTSSNLMTSIEGTMLSNYITTATTTVLSYSENERINHRRKFRYDKKSGKYVRIRKPPSNNLFANGMITNNESHVSSPELITEITTFQPTTMLIQHSSSTLVTTLSSLLTLPQPKISFVTSKKSNKEIILLSVSPISSTRTPDSQLLNSMRNVSKNRMAITQLVSLHTNNTSQNVNMETISDNNTRKTLVRIQSADGSSPVARTGTKVDTESDKLEYDFSGRKKTERKKNLKNNYQSGSNFTVVTALLDIGRGGWWEYRRPMTRYYEYLDILLKLKVNLIIFLDEKSVERVSKIRHELGLEFKTKIIPILLEDLPLSNYLAAANKIIESEQKNWKNEWDTSMKTHPEAKSASYNILVNSKGFFLHNASQMNPFSTEYFVWLDAGYGHGNESVFPYNFEWRPTFVPRKISVIKVTPEYDKISRYSLKDLYRKNWAVLSGGFIVGDIFSINRWYRFYYWIFVDMISRNFIDDDQTTLVLLVQQQPHLFNILHGDWFDAFKLFK